MLRLTLILLLTLSLARAAEYRLCGVDWPPFTNGKGGKIVSGLSFDIITEAFRRMGHRASMQILPWPRCLRMVERGQMDAIIDNVHSSMLLQTKLPNGSYPLAIYVRNESVVQRFSWSALEQETVGMVAGYDYPEPIASYDKWRRDYAVTDEEAIRKLAAKRYDYALLDLFAAPVLAKRLGVNIRMLQPAIAVTPLYLGFAPPHRRLVEQYGQALQAMQHDGTLDKLYRHHTSFSYQEITHLDVARMPSNLAKP